MDRHALEDALKETLEEHGLRLVEVGWKKNLEKRTLALALKVSRHMSGNLAISA